MKNVFPAYYHPSEEEFEDAWNDAIFVLDTNILLNLYRYPLQPRDELLEILRKLGDRVWIPFHVGLEYHRNRQKNIQLRQDRFSEVQKELTQAVNTLRGKVGGKKQHSIIDVNPLLEDMDALVSRFNESLPELRAADQVTLSSDPIRDQLDQIFEGRIGMPPSAPQLEELKKNVEFRYQHSIPPGYADAKKEGRDSPSFFYGGLQYQLKHGDYIIWSQLLAHAKEKGISKVIFLTDDEKEDWCNVIETSTKKIKTPRIELIEEIRREANVTFFYLYNSDSFLEYAKKYLDAKVEDTSIITVRDLLQEPWAAGDSAWNWRQMNRYVPPVITWLDSISTVELLGTSGRNATLILQNKETFDVSIRGVPDLATLHAELIGLSRELPDELQYRTTVVILVGAGETVLRAVKRWIRETPTLATDRWSIIYGEIQHAATRSPGPGDYIMEETFAPIASYGHMADELMWQDTLS